MVHQTTEILIENSQTISEKPVEQDVASRLRTAYSKFYSENVLLTGAAPVARPQKINPLQCGHN
ncbi:MAG: hypothetical protein JWM96_732 [Alphaproteobacteria bacterium]|nr:hypothetical protein [Alphaproteobacteria bacterium]